jgi:hypothetical protein
MKVKGGGMMIKSTSVKSRRFSLASVFIVVFLLFGYMATGIAQENMVDTDALTKETMKNSQEADEITLVWWIPEEYWGAIFAQDEEFMRVLRPYTIIVVANGKMDVFGGIAYESEATIQAGIKVKDSEGTRYLPISEDAIDADTKNLLSMLEPTFVNMLGPTGQNTHFFLFPAKNEKGQKIAEAKKEGTFSVELNEREFSWRLPLSSLLPPKICPTCGEKLSGAYKFCPWDGSKLPETKK